METASIIRWLSELGVMEDPSSFMHQCQMMMNEFSTNYDDHKSIFQQQYSFISSTTSTSSMEAATASHCQTGGSAIDSHRPTKKRKATDDDDDHNHSWNINNSSTITTNTGNLSTPPEAAASSSHPSPNIISFGNSSSSDDQQQIYGGNKFINTVNKSYVSKVARSTDDQQQGTTKSTSTTRPNSCSPGRTKPPSYNHDHIMAERRRREKLSQRFIALSALVPGLKKMDKASVLGDAIKYLKQMQEKVKILDEQTTKKTMESVIFVKKSRVSMTDDDTSSSSDENFISRSDDTLPEIEARVSDKNVLIRVHCEKRKGILVKTLAEIEKLHLTVVNSSVVLFGDSAFDITITAKMDVEFCMGIKDLVRNLRSSFVKFM